MHTRALLCDPAITPENLPTIALLAAKLHTVTRRSLADFAADAVKLLAGDTESLARAVAATDLSALNRCFTTLLGQVADARKPEGAGRLSRLRAFRLRSRRWLRSGGSGAQPVPNEFSRLIGQAATTLDQARSKLDRIDVLAEAIERNSRRMGLYIAALHVRMEALTTADTADTAESGKLSPVAPLLQATLHELTALRAAAAELRPAVQAVQLNLSRLLLQMKRLSDGPLAAHAAEAGGATAGAMPAAAVAASQSPDPLTQLRAALAEMHAVSVDCGTRKAQLEATLTSLWSRLCAAPSSMAGYA
jgi:hypothetical protein